MRRLFSAAPIRDAESRIVAGVVIFDDVTTEKAARADVAGAHRVALFLAEASGLLASSLDYEATLAAVARLAVPLLADWCLVDHLADDGTIRRLAVAHADPAKARLAQALRERGVPDPATAAGVARAHGADAAHARDHRGVHRRQHAGRRPRPARA